MDLRSGLRGLTAVSVAIICLTHATVAWSQQWAPPPGDDSQGIAAISWLLGGSDRTGTLVEPPRDATLATGSETGGALSSTVFQSTSSPILVDPARAWNADDWCLQILPDGLIYPSYLAGVRESRFASAWMHERDQGWIWDIALGGRVGLVRWGTAGGVRPEGWQLDIEGAGMPRLDLENDRDLLAVDFRFGVPLTYGRGPYQTKFAYYHLSSHMGDERMVRNNSLFRVNYVRDVLVWGHSYYPTEDLRLYGEVGWGFYVLDGAQPWEFQFGLDYSPAGPSQRYGAPFFAINAHLREEVSYGGSMVVQTGWQWRGLSDHLFRVGMEYFNGMSEQYEFFNQHEEKVGLGVWYDF